jgi:glutamyl-tRNA reductase
MPLSVFGINHKSAPVEVREQVAVPATDLPHALTSLCECPGVSEAAILSTCNRTEVYCQLDLQDNEQPLEWLLAHHQLSGVDLRPYLYHLPETETVRHLLRVAAGLDSMVLGEPQILGQLKDAYQMATDRGSIGRTLNRLFQHAFFVAKKIRTDTAIGTSPVSVAFAAVRLAQQIHGDLAGKTALLIGAGDMIELAANHLAENRLGRMLIANRSVDKAQLLASRFGGFALPLEDIPRHLGEADIVISSTAARLPVLGRNTVAEALRARRHQPMFLVDIAVPRDIAPDVAELEDVYLYTIDDLRSVIEENMRSRQAAALQAQEIVDLEANHFLEWMQQHDAVAILRQLRQGSEAIRDEMLAKAVRQIEHGQAPADALRQLANGLTNRLLHTPTVKLKDAGAEGHEELVRAAIELFDLQGGRRNS